MIEFKILKKSSKSHARLGILKTPHGEVETPTLVPVATQAVVKTLTSEEARRTGCQILIANTFHLHIRPGEEIVKKSGGLHAFMNWSSPIMTDSGGFQVFSLGFGHDLKMGKILTPATRAASKDKLELHAQPKKVTIRDDGVLFRSPLDGKELFIGPRESIKIQEALGADIMFAFDECTPPTATHEYIAHSLERTHRWATICLDVKKTKQALFGIVQGSRFRALREKSANVIGALPFDGFGIGGDLGDNKKTTEKILSWTLSVLPELKPRHLLGIGHPDDMERIIRGGVDLFDCIAPTHYARHGIAFTSAGRLDMRRKILLRDRGPLDPTCVCYVCTQYRRNYIAHLVRAHEITGLTLLTMHNLFFFNSFVEAIRKKIKQGKL